MGDTQECSLSVLLVDASGSGAGADRGPADASSSHLAAVGGAGAETRPLMATRR
jgi:hypothetical protein